MGPFRGENTSCLKLINTSPTLLTPSLRSASVCFLLSRFPLPQKSTSSASSEASETCQSVSECSSPTAVSTACAAQAHWQTHTHWYSHYSLLPVVQRGPWVPLGENSSWMLSTLTQTCLSIPQFGSCSSFGTFRPAFSHTGTIIRPLSVILPASPTFKHSPGSNTPSPTSKVPSWKVCFHLQFYFWLCSL